MGQERHERRQLPDALNHLFFLGELQIRSHHSTQRGQSSAVPSAWEISAPFLPGVIKSLGRSWLLLAAKQPPEGRATAEPLFGSEHREAQHETRESQHHGLGGKGPWSSSRSTPSKGSDTFY